MTVTLLLAATTGAVIAGAPTASAASESVLGTARPLVAAYPDGDSLTVGLRFTADASGSVSGVRFYKGAGNGGTHIGALYSSTGALLAQATFANETASGWQAVAFSKPVAVSEGGTYTAATSMPEGRYAVTKAYDWPVTGANLTGVAGTYNYGSTLRYPQSTYNASNYFIDVTFSAGAAAAPAPAPAPAPSGAAESTFPDESNTGVRAGTSLGTYNGPSVITTDGAVIDSKKITGCLDIRADNVEIRNSLIQSRGCFFNVLSDNDNTGLELTDVEIDGLGNTSGDSALNGGGFTCLRCDIHGTVDGIKAGDDAVVRDSYIHDLTMTAGSHNDGIQSLGTTSLRIIHNSIVVPPGSTSAIILSTGSAQNMRNVLIDQNLLGGGAYTVYGGYLAGTDSLSKVSNIAITNNRFTTQVSPRSGVYGPLTSTDDPVVVRGNTWYDGPNAGKSVY
ncbi:DUF4082 domain-containing protein [uncultured Friedmanniella sp.]|uniref:DUF4082 domain-containing protein n=1 Tax=uncultured Friedmanniella sp. TaxID=335381 RepID=UPI0035CB458C